MAEMKTLNGYEVVDEKARERLDTLVIPTKTSQLENDSQFTNKQYVDTAIKTAKPDLTGYYTQAQTDAAIQTAIGNIDIPTVPTKTSELTNDSNFVTETALETKGYLTAIPEEYVTDTELNNKGYQTASDVTTLINNALGVIENGTY